MRVERMIIFCHCCATDIVLLHMESCGLVLGIKVKQVLSHAKEFLKICLKNQLHSDTLNWSAYISSPGTRSNVTPMWVIFHCPHSSKPKLLCYRQNNVCTQLNSRECCFCTSEWEYQSVWACSPFSPSYHDLSTSLSLSYHDLSTSLSLSLSLIHVLICELETSCITVELWWESQCMGSRWQRPGFCVNESVIHWIKEHHRSSMIAGKVCVDWAK